jgi:hypothetical protein
MGSHIRAVLNALVSMSVAACHTLPIGGAGGPGPADLSDCRAQASRQAEMRYPRPPGDRSPRPPFDSTIDQSDRAAAERRYYDQCVQQKQLRSASSDNPAKSP